MGAPLKIYSVRVEMTRWADVHVVAESQDAAEEYALDSARDILDDASKEESSVEVSAATGGWSPGEMPYLTDEAKDLEEQIAGGRDVDCDGWADALKDSEPVVDDTTLPLALPYDDGRTERVTAVPHARAAGGVQ